MKILKLGHWWAAVKEMIGLLLICLLFICLTLGDVRAEAIGQMGNEGGGTITVFDSLCGKSHEAFWFQASSYSPEGGRTEGCWRVADFNTMEVEWFVNGRIVKALYPFDAFVNPNNT